LNEKSSGSRSRKQRLTAVGTRCADDVTPLYPRKLALTSPTGGGRSVGIVRVRTKATEFSFYKRLWMCTGFVWLRADPSEGGNVYSCSIKRRRFTEPVEGPSACQIGL